jgi:hypothetical protein
MARRQVIDALVQHVQDSKGWPDGRREGDGFRVRSGDRRTLYVEPVGGLFPLTLFQGEGSDGGQVIQPLEPSDRPAVNRNGVVVVISDCCGDGLP